MFLVVIVGLLFSCKQKETSVNILDKVSLNNEVSEKTYYNTKHLIEAEELLQIYEEENIVIIDFSKPDLYKDEHIIGALNIWRSDIEDTTFAYNGMMVDKETVEKLFSRLGIKNDDLLIIYDNRGACDAARLWWVLQNYGFDKVKLLNGGSDVWKHVGGEVTSEIIDKEVSEFILPDNPSYKYYLSKEEMQLAVNSPVIILDTRTLDEYSGKRQKSGAYKGGRILNSQLIDWAEAIDFNGTKKFKSVTDLEDIYGRLNASETDLIYVYCHSGVRSAHTTFVLTQLLGYKNVKNYDGSWIEWSYFEELPFVQDSVTIVNK